MRCFSDCGRSLNEFFHQKITFGTTSIQNKGMQAHSCLQINRNVNRECLSKYSATSRSYQFNFCFPHYQKYGTLCRRNFTPVVLRKNDDSSKKCKQNGLTLRTMINKMAMFGRFWK